MKQYKGYSIDGVQFKSESEVDSYIRDMRIFALKLEIIKFFEELDYNASERVKNLESELINDFGLTWKEVDEIETETAREVA